MEKKQEAKKPCQGQKEEGEGATARFVKKKKYLSQRISKTFSYVAKVNSFQNPAICDNVSESGGHCV